MNRQDVGDWSHLQEIQLSVYVLFSLTLEPKVPNLSKRDWI